MNGRAVTPPQTSSADDDRAASTPRLVAWAILVGLMIAAAYAARAASSTPDDQVLYEWSTAVGSLVQDGLVLVLVLAIARGSARLLALRRPAGLARTGSILLAALVGIYVWEGIYSALAHPGNEQGLTPSHWEPRHAAAYVVNSVVICTFVPFVEELTFRGLGVSLLERFGRWPAILLVGVVFGLAHGLVVSLPVLMVFGAVLAWVRVRTGSVLPGMVLHGTFNLIALVAAVTIQH
ncbi:MAG TPA: type II CAAX endopeptidase family protein [Gaiellaceae bacterium]|nr:type II CAAX endopeptidase family protein [Gaiellaceae bacterium]